MIVQRYQLIQTLDTYCFILLLIYFAFDVLACCLKQCSKLAALCRILAYLSALSILAYLYWRIFLAWRNLYY